MKVAALFLLIAAVSFGSDVSASEFPDISDADCSSAENPEFCRGTLETLKADIRNARKGKYQSIRNIAYCLESGCDGVIGEDIISGCAWRIVAIAKAPSRTDKVLDEQRFMSKCKVYASDRLTSAMIIDRADAIYMEIFKRKLP